MSDNQQFNKPNQGGMSQGQAGGKKPEDRGHAGAGISRPNVGNPQGAANKTGYNNPGANAPRGGDRDTSGGRTGSGK